MNDKFISFDATRSRIVDVLRTSGTMSTGVESLYLIRDLFGKVRITVPDDLRANESCRNALQCFASRIHEELGAHGYPMEQAILFVSADRLKTIQDQALKISSNVY